jgi:hypothetical protein
MQTPAGKIEFEVSPEWGRLYEIGTGGVYEPLLLNALYEILSEDSVFFNIGSRWGIFSIFAEECGVNNRKIHNFEADERTFNLLKRNVSEDQISNNFYVSDSDSGDSIKLDSYIKNHEKPTIIKIDIEGAEWKAIQGSRNLLKAHMPELFIEVHPKYIRDMGGSQDNLFSFLRDIGYELKIVNHRSDSNWTSITDVKIPAEGDYLLHAK